jgi:hypothetical protein|tara:strand:- start:878 stop:1156 length:279 start_codon:yes stop_codon:yes gene_type:complete
VSRLEHAIEYMEDIEIEPMLLLGQSEEINDYAEAFVGVILDESKAVYDEDKIIKVLMERDGMTDMDAIEFFEFNIRGSYMGDRTPMYIKTDF